ncbi:MAG: helix-turn-helix transcriptional regulator [Leptospirales bacterium]|nr:helix-turn-helix transcriptional regulator [Leptospirales bacterium]
MLTTYIAAANIALLVLISILLLPDSKTRANRYLLAFFVIMTFAALLRLGFLAGGKTLTWLPFVVFPGAFLLGPLLFFYVRATLFGKSPRRWELLTSLIAPILAFLIHAGLNVVSPETADPSRIQTMEGLVGDYTRFLFFSASVYNLYFLLLAWFLLRDYKREVMNNFSNTLRDEQGWIRTILLASGGLALVYFSMSIIAWVSSSFFIPVGWPEGGVMLVLAYLAIFYLVKKPQIFSIQQLDATESTGKYAKQNLSDAMRKEYLQKIETYFESEKPYLDERVTLAGLSAALNIPAHHFSMVINIEKNLNFFNFVNSYRIAEAKRLLDDPSTEDTVLTIAFSAGFQSKAVFNRVFKEQTGLTPTAYRQQQIKKT